MESDENNCFVCSEYLGPFKNGLDTVIETSGKLVYKLLEPLLNINIKKSILKSSSVCQDCFIKLQKYEELQMEAEKVQVNLINLYHKQSTDKFEAVHIKIESQENLEMVIRCTRCAQQFNSLKELCGHKNCDVEEFSNDSDEDYTPKRRKSKRNNKKLNTVISKDFKELAGTKDIDYNIESFHRAFGAPIERDDSQKNQKELKPAQVTRPQLISPEFSKMLKQHGIDYNLQTFHRVFGFSDSLELQKKSKTADFKCVQCDKEFMKLQLYKDHVKTHTKGDYRCDECQTNFQKKVSYLLHASSNHGLQKEGPFACSACHKSFKKKEILRKHLVIHGDERKHLCTQCGASFLHLRSYQMHLMYHDDIRPFECRVCNKRFRDNSKLTVHMRIHTGERKYKCKLCPDKTFRQQWGLDLHMKNIHSNKSAGSESCQICGDRFVQKSKLRHHLANSHQVANAEHYEDSDEDHLVIAETESE